MFQKRKLLIASGSALALALGASLAFAGDSSTSPNSSDTQVNTEPGSQGKTSDRTPGEAAPDRTPNASTTGNTGTDAGQTNEGTSDRTPKEGEQK